MEITVHNSSLVKHIKYNKLNSELTVQFIKGDVYVYQNVAKVVADAIGLSDSPGAEFNRLVRNNPKYTFYKNNRLAAGIEKVTERTNAGGYTKPRTTAHKAQATTTTPTRRRTTKSATSKKAAPTRTPAKAKSLADTVIDNVRRNMAAKANPKASAANVRTAPKTRTR